MQVKKMGNERFGRSRCGSIYKKNHAGGVEEK